MAEIYRNGTEYTGNQLTLARGNLADITAVGVLHSTDPNVVPAVEDFVDVIVVDETSPLGLAGQLRIITKVGPKSGDEVLAPGVYQRFLLVQTSDEDIIRKADTIEVL